MKSTLPWCFLAHSGLRPVARLRRALLAQSYPWPEDATPPPSRSPVPATARQAARRFLSSLQAYSNRFITAGCRRDRTLLPVKGGLRPLSHTPEINNAEFYDNDLAGNFPDRLSRFSGGNNPVPCHADLLAKAINPCELAFGQLHCVRGKMRHIQTFH